MKLSELNEEEYTFEEEIQEAKPLKLSQIDDKDIEFVEDEPEGMGALEAGATGLAEGGTFGLAPIISGAQNVAMESLEDIGDALGLTQDELLRQQGFKIEDDYEGLEGIKKAFYEGRERFKKQSEKAFEEQPIAASTGLLGGALASAALTPASITGLGKMGKTGQTLAKALSKVAPVTSGPGKASMGQIMKEGAKAGALTGFGQGEAKLLEGDVLETAIETGAAAGTGAATAGALGGLGKLVKKTGKAIGESGIGQAFKLGRSGETLVEESIGKYRGGIRGRSKQLINEVNKTIKDLSSKRSVMLKEKATNIDLTDEINKLKLALDDLPSGTGNLRSDITKVKNVLDDITYDMKNLSGKEAQTVYDELKELSAVGDKDRVLQTKDVRKLINNISVNINESLANATDNPELYKKLGTKMNTLLSMRDYAYKGKTVKKVDIEKQIDKLTNLFVSTEDPTRAQAAQLKVDNLAKMLKEVRPDLYDRFLPKITKLQNYHDLAKTAGQKPPYGIYGPRQLSLKGANILGQARKSGDDAIKGIIRGAKDWVNTEAPTLNRILEVSKNKAIQGSEYFENQIEKAILAPEPRRRAMLLGLYNQPAFREYLFKLGDETKEEFVEE